LLRKFAEGQYLHHFDGEKYISGDILSGSALTMAKAVKNCVQHAGIELSKALRMAGLYPARVVRLEDKLGRFEKSYLTSFVVLVEALSVVDTI
jgi:N-acetylglucosamine-6-phosphate deacetylase